VTSFTHKEKLSKRYLPALGFEPAQQRTPDDLGTRQPAVIRYAFVLDHRCECVHSLGESADNGDLTNSMDEVKKGREPRLNDNNSPPRGKHAPALAKCQLEILREAMQVMKSAVNHDEVVSPGWAGQRPAISHDSWTVCPREKRGRPVDGDHVTESKFAKCLDPPTAATEHFQNPTIRLYPAYACALQPTQKLPNFCTWSLEALIGMLPRPARRQEYGA
jgi:hypothetical protein